MKPFFINKYNWEGINCLSEIDDWKKFEKNNLKNALNVLHAKKEKNISCSCFNCKKQVARLIILNEEGWHYHAVKKLSALLREITSKHHNEFYCLNSLHSFATENKCESHKKYVKIKIFVIL